MKPLLAVLLVPLAVVGAAAAVVLRRRRRATPARAAIERYLAAWSRGDDAAAAALTDDPRRRRAALRLSRAGLDGAGSREGGAASGEEGARTVRCAGRCRASARWAYDVAIAARERDDKWRVHWRDALVHPRLTAAPGSARRSSGRAARRSWTAAAARSSPTGRSWTSACRSTRSATRRGRPQRSPRPLDVDAGALRAASRRPARAASSP